MSTLQRQVIQSLDGLSDDNLNFLLDQDPFDRIMVAQAKVEGMMFLTHDGLIQYYMEPFIIQV